MAATEVADTASIPPRKAARRRLARLSLGHLIMILAGLLAVVTNLALLQAVDQRVQVAVAGRDIPSGSAVTETDLRLTSVAADLGLLDQLITETRASGLTGITSRDLAAGDLVLISDLVSAAAPQRRRAMSIPVEREHAVGGSVRVGDRVDIVAVRDGTAEFVLIDAEVLAVAGPGSGPLGATRDFFVTVAIEADDVLRLAEALDAAAIEVILSTGAAPLRPISGER